MARGARRVACAVAVCAAFVGCGGETEQIAFDEISRLPTREELAEVEIGHFEIPIPAGSSSSNVNTSPHPPLLLRFQLIAIVPPDKVSRVQYYMDRHRGKIRDEVIQLCRSTARENLYESEWATLKAHLLDAIQPVASAASV